mmetsp:Transcript_12045/g.34064  ORF Transcript_12045/g.34064 Transcript_12045/m.34064 type:complete len:250 (+) Transcript_12045:365-1114(+)
MRPPGGSPSWGTCPFTWAATARTSGPTGVCSSWTRRRASRPWFRVSLPMPSLPPDSCGAARSTTGRRMRARGTRGGSNGCAGPWNSTTRRGLTTSGLLQDTGRSRRGERRPWSASGRRARAFRCSTRCGASWGTSRSWPRTWASSRPTWCSSGTWWTHRACLCSSSHGEVARVTRTCPTTPAPTRSSTRARTTTLRRSNGGRRRPPRRKSGSSATTAGWTSITETSLARLRGSRLPPSQIRPSSPCKTC